MTRTTTPSARSVAPALERALEEYLAHLAVERGLSEHTLSAYRRDLERYTAYLDGRGRRRLSDVAEYVEVLRTGSDGGRALAVSSAGRAVVAVRGWHRFAVLEGHAPQDPSADVRAPATARRLPKALSTDDVERLLEAASLGEGPVPLRDRALLEVLYGTGARISEAVGLSADDLDLDGGTVRLFGKGRRERVVPVGRFAVEAVEAYLVRARPVLATAGRGTPALFLNQRGNPLSRQSAWAVLQTAGARAGLGDRVSPHTLRHSFATHALSQGAELADVQKQLGHVSISTTQIYRQMAGAQGNRGGEGTREA